MCGRTARLPLERTQFAKFASLDRREQVLACVKLVKRFGLDFLVLDQTRPDIEVPVVRVIVPGLRHFYRRFAPGRLYDVPLESRLAQAAGAGSRAQSPPSANLDLRRPRSSSRRSKPPASLFARLNPGVTLEEGPDGSLSAFVEGQTIALGKFSANVVRAVRRFANGLAAGRIRFAR